MSESTVIPVWLKDIHALAMAVLDDAGRVTEFNLGFGAAVAEQPVAATPICLAKPDVATLAGTDGLAYSGAIVFSGGGEGWGALSGSIYRVAGRLLVVAEVGVSAFVQLKGEIDRLNRELEETQRHLTRRNLALDKALSEVEALKRQDTLTGLANRQSLDERIRQEISRWERYRRPLALVLMEMDDFGGVNESYGREVGDELLRHVATILSRSVRATDMVARYGGLEFALLLPETNEMGALIVAERLRMELESQIILPMVRPLTASFGVAMLLPGETNQELYTRAGRAVAHSKKNGRNCVTMAGVIDACDQIYHAAAGSQNGPGPQQNV